MAVDGEGLHEQLVLFHHIWVILSYICENFKYLVLFGLKNKVFVSRRDRDLSIVFVVEKDSSRAIVALLDEIVHRADCLPAL